MPIRIEFKKVLVKGDRYVKIVKEQALKKDKLPAEYLREKPWVFCNNTGDCLMLPNNIIDVEIYGGSRTSLVEVRYLLTPDSFTRLIAYLRKCGDRLKEVNERIEEDRKKWVREGIVVI